VFLDVSLNFIPILEARQQGSEEPTEPFLDVEMLDHALSLLMK
jgi:hypothetical protein